MFAVAITLLVLDIKVPPVPTGNSNFSLEHELLQQWPSYLAFVTSFLTILIMWINHHRIFGLIMRVNSRFLIYNGLLLLTVTLIPFSTSLLAAYARLPDARLAAFVYSGSNVLLAVCFSLVWRYASHNNLLLARDHDRQIAKGITKSYRLGPLLYIIACALSFISVTMSFGFCMLLALYFTLPPRTHAPTE